MLCKCEPAVTVTLMKLFAKYKAAPEGLLEELLDTPRMRGHLSTIATTGQDGSAKSSGKMSAA